MRALIISMHGFNLRGDKKHVLARIEDKLSKYSRGFVQLDTCTYLVEDAAHDTKWWVSVLAEALGDRVEFPKLLVAEVSLRSVEGWIPTACWSWLRRCFPFLDDGTQRKPKEEKNEDAAR